MKPVTRKKIEAAINSGRQFESVGQLAKAADVNRQTVSLYKLKFGIPDGVIVSSRERITQALMQAAKDGATTLSEAAKVVGVKYSTAVNASEYDQNINLTLTLNKEKAKRDRMQKIVSEFDRHLAAGVSFSEASKLTGLDAGLYYSSCYGLGVEIYSQRTSKSGLRNAQALRKRQEEERAQQRRDMLTGIIGDFDELQRIGYTAPEAAKKLDMNKNRYYAACYELGVKIYTQRPENQPEPPQRVSRPSGLYNKLLTGRISASA